MPMFGKDSGKLPWALAGSGIELAGTVGILAAFGWWLDRKWHTSPWLLLVGSMLGVVGGLYNVWRIGRRYMNK